MTLLLCQPHLHISAPAGYTVGSCPKPTVIPWSTGSPAVEAAALYATSGSLMDVHRVLHDHRHLGLQLSIADALFKELCGGEKTSLWAVMGETLQAMKQSQGTAHADGLSQVMTFNTSLDLHKQQSMKLQNITRMKKLVTKPSSPQQVHTQIIERTATIYFPSIIPKTTHDSASVMIKLLNSLATEGSEALLTALFLKECGVKPGKSNCRKGGVGIHGQGFLNGIATTNWGPKAICGGTDIKMLLVPHFLQWLSTFLHFWRKHPPKLKIRNECQKTLSARGYLFISCTGSSAEDECCAQHIHFSSVFFFTMALSQ